MKKLFITIIAALAAFTANAANPYDNPDTLVVSRDGTGQFRTINEAVEVCRAFMEYHKVIYVKKGVYKEKVIIPSWLTNIEVCGEDAENTIITYDDHANIRLEDTNKPMGTFRTYTVKVEGNYITFKNITIENNAAKLGQAVALHTEGDHLVFVNCRLLGNQDTVYTGLANTRLYFKNCYIEGTTDFIFGPSTAWFEGCTIHSKQNSYVTAASTPADVAFGYVFNRCKLTAAEGVTKVYLDVRGALTPSRCHELRAWQSHSACWMAQLGQGFERKDSTLHGIQQQRCRSNNERKGTVEQTTDKKRGCQDNS